MTDDETVRRVARNIATRTPEGGRRASRLLDRAAGRDTRRWLRLHQRALERVEEMDAGGRDGS